MNEVLINNLREKFQGFTWQMWLVGAVLLVHIYLRVSNTKTDLWRHSNTSTTS